MDKQQIIAENRIHETDTGSTEVQIALLTARINHLTEHLKTHQNYVFPLCLLKSKFPKKPNCVKKQPT